MRALWMAVAERWWGRGCGVGGWTVAFSRPDKSKKERLVINVRKWPRVTGRPSPVTALKRGHLHNHPSHWHTQTQSYTLLVGVFVCAKTYVCLCLDYTNFPSFTCRAYKYMYICMAHFRVQIQSMVALEVCVFVERAGLNTGWVAQKDHWPLEEDIWPPFFSSPVLEARQSDTNALLIGLCFTMAIAPLSARRRSTVIPHLSVRKGPFLLEEMRQNMYAQKHSLKNHVMFELRLECEQAKIDWLHF